MIDDRIPWDRYFMEFAKLASTRTTCFRRAVGAVLVRDKQILATGYNGAPRGLKHCRETGCVRKVRGIPSGERQELCRGLHAEHNAFLQAAREGISTLGATLYCTNQPCSICVRMLIQAGVVRIVYLEEYNDEFAANMLAETEIAIEQLK